MITIHGLWMNGFDMALLRRRLRRAHGFACVRYRYPTLSGDLDSSIERLRRFIEARADGPFHIVAHSLGGVVTLHTLTRYPELPVERVVCLGSPLVGSAAARTLQRSRPGRAIAGRTLLEGAIERPLDSWAGRQRVACIAGTRTAGIGMLIARIEAPHDGDVAVAETRLPGIADHAEFPVNHMGLLLSADVAACTGRFLTRPGSDHRK